jgi:ABC-type transporter lipoprotein component MlaA/pimeloyl-ACP methyl ester carboxylesterase
MRWTPMPEYFRIRVKKAGSLNIQSDRRIQCLARVILLLCFSPFGRGQAPGVGSSKSLAEETVALPKPMPDPLEPFNRVMWGFNKGLMTDFVKPTSKVYRFVVVKPVRIGFGNMGRNLAYPGRFINNLLQEKWSGARDESYRFVCNTTVGVGGFFDVAEQWKIPISDADFGQTLGQWGWKPSCFLMLPILGPSDERDVIGLAADSYANPLFHINPYRFDGDNPLTYLGPYTYFTYAVMYNDLADTVADYVRFSQAEMDPYTEIRYVWSFARDHRMADFQVKGKQDEASLESLGALFFTYKDPEFPNSGKTRSVLIPATGRQLKFTFWLQPRKAPLVYIVPGLGSHRLAKTSLALAELVYKQGFSAVCVSSPFNSEFIENASTAALPAYLPVDGHDLHVALTEIDRHLNALYPDRLGERALMGYSMGALHTLFVAATEPTNHLPLIKFDRYVAIDTPVRLQHGISVLDDYYQAPLSWPVAERADNLENTFLKVAALSRSTPTPQRSPPFSAIESKFLLGLSFRFMLKDIIFSTQRRNNEGLLRQPISNLRREPVYQEILHYSIRDYFEKFAIPYYQNHVLGLNASAALEKAEDLRTYDIGLRLNPNIRIIVNQNDFLLEDEDLAWLHATFTPERLTVFAQGGHMGNLSDPVVQQAILGTLAGLKSSPANPADPLKRFHP